MISAALGIQTLDDIDDDEIKRIMRAHLLLAMFNALQPGVFALSGWDLAGMLTIDPDSVRDLIRDGDTRWINRGAHDLIGLGGLDRRGWGLLPAGRSLYGSLPDQLRDPSSFASQLARIIDVRRRYEIHLADQLDIPDVPHHAMLVLLHRLPSGQQHVLALNFAEEDISGTVRSEYLAPHSAVTDMFGGWDGQASVDDLNSFHLTLGPCEGFSLLVRSPIGPEPPPAAPPAATHRVVDHDDSDVTNRRGDYELPTESHWVPRQP